jgi:LacI family transcriptional regulator, galactose operon repressor
LDKGKCFLVSVLRSDTVLHCNLATETRVQATSAQIPHINSEVGPRDDSFPLRFLPRRADSPLQWATQRNGLYCRPDSMIKTLRKVAVLIDTSREIGRGLLRGITRFHREKPRWTIFLHQRELGAAIPSWVRSWRGDGILACIENAHGADELSKTGMPLISLRGAIPGRPAFGPDSMSIARVAYEHLASCGLENFAVVNDPNRKHVYDNTWGEELVKLLGEHGRECHMFHSRPSGRGTKTLEAQQQQLAIWLRQLPKPIGVMCCHDHLGQQVLDVCRLVGLRVPDEIAVMGVGNDELLCPLSVPPLTSIDVGPERIGYEAASLLERTMSGEKEHNTSVLFQPVGVVKRQSTDVIYCEDPEIARALRFIRENGCKHLSVNDVHRQVRLSRTLLNRRFKNQVGHTLKEEILRVQMELATRLLVTSPDSIASIADKCGFNEAWYFITVFRRYTGVTPGVYRKKFK